MRNFNYSEIKNQKWDSETLSLVAAIYKAAGKQELFLKQRPQEPDQQQMTRVEDVKEPFQAPAPLPVVQEDRQEAQQAEPVDADVAQQRMPDHGGAGPHRQRIPAQQEELLQLKQTLRVIIMSISICSDSVSEGYREPVPEITACSG